MREVFIIGSKGIPANYGGFETFVDKLTEKRKSTKIRYHVACMSDENTEFEHNRARCFNVKVPNIGAAKAVYYDIKALIEVIKYIKRNDIKKPYIYILACRIGPFMFYFKKKIEQLGGQIFVNPDGHEWKRAKWNWAIRNYWKISERYMVKYADLLICDSKNIEKYIKEDYMKYEPETTYISYGSDIKETVDINEQNLTEWYKEKNVKTKEYYLIVGRFVPENNYELIIKEFMKSNINKDLVIITNIEKNKFYNELSIKTKFLKDKRIKFVGTVYNQDLLEYIRRNAYGYLHGHEVGGTNPSLLEALATTRINLLLNVGFNKEVAEDGAIYFEKNNGDLTNKLQEMELLNENEIENLSKKAKHRIIEKYNWDFIVKEYENLFMK